MDKWQAVIITMAAILAVGIFFGILGIWMWKRYKNKIKSCTATTTGHVCRYRFLGKGQMYPIIEFQAKGQTYMVARRFRGFVTKRKIIPGGGTKDQQAYVSQNDYLVICTGAVTNMRALAENLWPLGSDMTVFYDPSMPKRAFAEKIPTRIPVVPLIFMIMGGNFILFSSVVMILMTIFY